MSIAPTIDKTSGASTPDEKYDLEGNSSTGSPSLSSVDLIKDWTDAEEKRVVRKLDATVLFLLVFGFFCFQLERGNMANAVSSTLFKDISIDQNDYNTGQGLVYMGIVLLEIPSQIVLQKLGPQKWLTFQILCFGLVSTLQMFMNNYGSFIATRILLGITECGYIPAALYTISTFYTQSETGTRFSILYVGNVIVGGVGNLLASGILRLEGSLRPWQYLFLIEGLIAIACFFIFLIFFPESPRNPLPLFFKNLTLFSPREREIIFRRVVIDDEKKVDTHRALRKDEILGALGNWRNWPHVLHGISMIATTVAISQYLPLLIKGFGFDTIKANALASVGYWLSLCTLLGFGYISDRYKLRGPIVIVSSLCFLVMWIAFQAKSTSPNKWIKYALLVLTYGFTVCWHPINATWLSLNQPSPQHRAIAMAMFIMSANTGAVIGSQMMRKSDAPLYRVGFRACIALVAFGNVVAIGQHLQYRWSNRRNERKTREEDGKSLFVYTT